jgi:hypothetical protein
MPVNCACYIPATVGLLNNNGCRPLLNNNGWYSLLNNNGWYSLLNNYGKSFHEYRHGSC